MDLTLLMALFFLVSMALFLSALYFIVAKPAANRALRSRLEAIREESSWHSANLETELLRHEVLSQIPALNRILSQMRLFLRLNLYLQQAAVRITVGTLLIISIAPALGIYLVVLLWNGPFVTALWFALLAGSIPFVAVAIKRKRRFSRFEEQFPNAIDLLARAVRAGHAFTTGLQLIGSDMPEPVAAEFRRMYEQQNLGLPLQEALRNLLARVPIPDMHVFVMALIIQRESGGNLAEILDTLSRLIRERFKLVRQVRVYTAQGRMSLYLLVALPPCAVLILYLLNRDYISRLFTDPLGQQALTLAAVLQLMGYMAIRRIIQPKA